MNYCNCDTSGNQCPLWCRHATTENQLLGKCEAASLSHFTAAFALWYECRDERMQPLDLIKLINNAIKTKKNNWWLQHSTVVVDICTVTLSWNVETERATGHIQLFRTSFFFDWGLKVPGKNLLALPAFLLWLLYHRSSHRCFQPSWA